MASIHQPRELMSFAGRAGWLAERFAALSLKYPMLRLVAVRRPESLDQVEMWRDDEDYSDPYPVVNGRYERQSLQPECISVPCTVGQNTFPILQLSLPDFSFPSWHFSEISGPWEQGFWEMWLHRDIGRDPSARDNEIPNPIEQLSCMEQFNLELDAAACLGAELYDLLGWNPWPFERGGYWSDGSPFFNGFDISERMVWWCLFLLCLGRHRQAFSKTPRMEGASEASSGKRKAYYPHELWIIDDVGALSAEFLRHTRARLETMAEAAKAKREQPKGIASVDDDTPPTKQLPGEKRQLTRKAELLRERDDWLLDCYDGGKLTYPELLELLGKEAVRRNWALLDNPSSVASALKRAYQRRHNELWPFDGRGKSKKRKN